MNAAAGVAHTVLVRDDGAAVAFGDASHGACRVPEGARGGRVVSCAAGGYHTVRHFDSEIRRCLREVHRSSQNVSDGSRQAELPHIMRESWAYG